LHAHRRAIALGDLPGVQRGDPVAPEEVAHQGAAVGSGEVVVLFLGQHGESLQSACAPEARTTGAHRLISAATKAVNCCGSGPPGPRPWGRSRSRTSGSLRIGRTSAFSRFTISGGIPAGPDSENQIDAVSSGKPSSAKVGTSGNSGIRLSEVTARARALPAL